MPTSSPPYTAWPTSDDVLARLQAAGVTLRAADAAGRIDQLLAAIADEIQHTTRRQFIADTEQSIRVFDGNGTAEVEIDEFVALGPVTVIGYQAQPSYELADVSYIQEKTKPFSRIILARGSVPAWQTQAVLYPQYVFFPAGRQNIQVMAQWGYAASIPADLWEAVCGEVAVRATRETQFQVNGRISEEVYGDERRKYQLDPAEALGWHEAYTRAIGDGPGGYKRPTGRRLRRLRGPVL